jgi:PAS domain S-box-containing protein
MAEQIYGWTSQEAAGRNIVELTPGDFARAEAAEIMAALQRGEPWSGEFLVRAKDGSRFTVHVVDIPVAADDGTLVGIVGISRRVSYTGP